MIRRALAILRRELGPVCVYALFVVPLGALMVFCLIGVFILAHGLGQLASVLVRGARQEHLRAFDPEPAAGWAGALALSGIAALLGTTLVASGAAGAVLGEGDAIAQSIAAVLAAAMAGAALAPFALAPVIAAGGEGGLVRPIARSVELATRLGARRLAAIGAAGGALYGGAFIGGSAAAVLSESAIVIVAAVLVPLAGLVFALALLADAYVRASVVDADDRAPTPAGPPAVIERSPREAGMGLRRLAVVLAPLVVLPSAAALVAALTPTPMQPLEGRIYRGSHLLDEHLTLPLGTPDRTRALVRQVYDGVEIEAPDGGGAGHVRAGFVPGGVLVEDGQTYGGPPGSFAVTAISRHGPSDMHERAYTIVDGDGVRLDDSLEDRVLGRLGIVGGSAVALGLLLLLVLAGRLGMSLGEARTLDARDLATAGKGVRRALEGELSMSGATLTRSPGAIRVEGEAWIVAGDLRVRLPPRPIRALGEGEPRDGQSAVLISRFRTALTANLREAGAAWPDDGLLVLGTLAEARDTLARRAITAAAWIVLPLGACVFTASAMLLVHL